MIEIEVPKDITKYEAKLVGSFTSRNVACLVIAAVFTVPTFLLLKDKVPNSLAMLVVLLEAAPWVLLGWVRPYGMKFEQFVKTAFISNVLAPKHRKYVSVNNYDLLEDPDYIEKMASVGKLMTHKEMRKEMDAKIESSIKCYA